MRVNLGYGSKPLACDVPDDAEVVLPPRRPSLDVPVELAAALAHPVGAGRLRGRVRAGARVTVIVSDATRAEPRGAFVRAILDELEVPVDLTLAVANGTHAPGDVAALEVPAARLVNHDGAEDSGLVDLGRTRRGTRVRLPRFLLDSELVIATGVIRPHYFAGYGAGVKAIFPGLGHRDDIRQNHLLKSDPTARLGRVDDNVCRLDMEEAARLLPVEAFLLNLADRGAVAGDIVLAHRLWCNYMSCSVMLPPADVVITSDVLPVSGSLYQASKLVVPAGRVLRPGGTVILAAECPFGVGPAQIVNQGIYEIGIRKALPEPHIIYLVSSLPENAVATTYCRYAPTVESVLASLSSTTGRVVVFPYAAHLIPTPISKGAP